MTRPDDELFAENERTKAAPGVLTAQVGVFQTATGHNLKHVEVAYQTWGELNSDRSNAILVCHALSGNSNAVGWWERLIGPGKAIDTNRFFVVGSNALGGCNGTTGPRSLDEDGKPYGSRFPVVLVEDMVDIQVRLADHLGIDVWLLVCGGSMGGLLALDWSVRYPARVTKAWLTASTAKHSALQIGFNEAARQAIFRDPKWCHGDYQADNPPDDGLAVARMIGHISYLSEASFTHKFGRNLQAKDSFDYNLGVEFSVESYLTYQGEKFCHRFDASSLVYLSKAIDYYECTSLATSRCEFLFTSFSSDWLYPTWQSQELHQMALGAGRPSTFVEIESPWGHDSFLLNDEVQADCVRTFLGS